MIAAAANSRTVLIATTATAVRDRFADALCEAGHRTLEAERTSELFQLVDTGRPGVDLLLLDLRLAHGDGTSLVRRAREQYGGLPIVVFSGSVGSAGEVRELAALGITGYVNEHSNTRQILPSLAPHLFPDSFNRRSSPRVVLAIPVSYRFEAAIAGALTVNLGKGGLAVGTMSPLEVSTKVRAHFRLPSSSGEIDAESRVVWRDQRVGMGLQFERVDAGSQTAIDEYVDRYQPGAGDAAPAGEG
jgi:CheY-like chemotaxis protein